MIGSTAVEDAEGIVRIRALRKGLDVATGPQPGPRAVTVLEEGRPILVVTLEAIPDGFRAELRPAGTPAGADPGPPWTGGADLAIEASDRAGRRRFTDAVAAAIDLRSARAAPPASDPEALARLAEAFQDLVEAEPVRAGAVIAGALGEALGPADVRALEAALRRRRAEAVLEAAGRAG